jgi:hypothetical protein
VPSLQDLSTNLANHQYYSGVGAFNANKLPFGRDTPGGGDSGQPFVVRRIDQRWSPSNMTDSLTPFGAVTTVTRTLKDVERVSKFMYTSIMGPMFLIKQTGLQATNPDTQQLGNKLGSLRTYNPLGINTLAQVAVNASGVKFTKHGLTPTVSKQDSYEKFALKRDEDYVDRLYILTDKLSNKERRNYIDKYVGGPESFFGIGSTTINRSYYTLNNGVADDFSGFISVPISNLYKIFPTMTGGGIPTSRDIYVDPTKTVEAEGEFVPPNLIAPGVITPEARGNTYILGSNYDFRIYKNALNKKSSPKGNELPESNYTTYNLESRIGVARVRKPEHRIKYEATASADGRYNFEKEYSDRINAIGLYYAAGPAAKSTDVNGKIVNDGTPETSIRDIVKFRIKILDNDKRPVAKTGDSFGVYIVFRAYISNIRRNIVSKWDPYKYVGRGESFYAYDGFTETITYSFVIAASSRAEMKPLYQKLNYLISSMAPDYRDNLMRGNIAELTIGDFVLYQPGIITNFDMNIDEDSNWEIALQEPEQGQEGTDTDMHELPHLIKCNMTFIPIYNFLPRKSAEAPFIGIDDPIEKKPGKMWLDKIGNKLKENKSKVIVGDATKVQK